MGGVRGGGFVWRIGEKSTKMMDRETYRFIETAKNISMEFVKRARSRGKGVYLYGAGNHLPFVVSFARKYQIKINAILDTSPREAASIKHQIPRGCQKIPIIQFVDFIASNPERDSWFLVSAPSAYEPIARTISAYFPRENIFNFETLLYNEFIPDVEEYRRYLLKNWEALSGFHDALADDISKKTLVSVLKGRITGNLAFFSECFVPDQYYTPSLIRFAPGEVMVELGANNGDTLLEFMRRCPDFKTAYCFESGSDCLPRLREIAAGVPGKNVHIVPKGAWDCETVLRFSSEGDEAVDAHIVSGDSTGAEYTIETVTVDDTVKEPISYMKMDIEGSEKPALRGARRQIAVNKPKLAVCVYHRIEDFLEIWRYLTELVPDYRFYLRHHLKACGADTVLYAMTEGDM